MEGPPDDEANRRVHRLIEESSDVIAVVDTGGEFTYLSPSIERVLGYEAEDLLGEVGFDYIHPDDLETAQRQFTAMIDDPSLRPTVEFRFEVADGSWRWLEARGRNLLDDPVVEGIVVYVRDVTMRKTAERDLRSIRDRMEFALDATDSVVYEIDFEDGTVARHGPFEQIFGVTSERVPDAETFRELAVHPDDRDVVEATETAAAEGRTDSVEYEFRTHPDLSPVRWIRSKAFVPNGEGTDRLIGLSTDITSLKQREAELERKNERLDQFASMVSHDLRNPLNVASGRLELAREEADSDHFEPLERALVRMSDLIDDLLALARQGVSEIELEEVSLASAVEQCWETVRTDDAEVGVESDPILMADPNRFNQLLENLFRNAIEHAGSDVTVTVGAMDGGFFVEDDGPGIPDGDRETVFEAGYSTIEGGSGLGLTIVEQVVDEHDWTVRISEGSDGGARLELTGVEFANE